MEAKFKRNSSRSSIRASKMPASALFAMKKRKNRYDQLESTSDQVDDAEQVEQAMLNESNSQYVTLVNQSDDENKNAFENVNFFYPTEDDETEKLDDSSSSSTHCPIDPLIVGEKQRRTPPPIPARRQSNKDTEQQQHHVVPPPIPAPPRRNDSRKGRKRPTYLETCQSSLMMDNQLFPTEIAHRHLSASLTLDSISTTEPMLIRTSVSHDFGDTKTTDDDIAQLLLPSASTHRQTDSRIGHHEGGGPLKKEEDDYSDFEIIDLVLADDSNGDSSSDNDDRQNIKGSTNNLADFDDVEDAQLEEKIEQMTLTQLSTVEFANSPPDAIMDHHGHHHGGDEEEKGDFQTEKLLKLTNDASIRALVKLPKSRRQKFRTRSNWAQVSLSIGAGSCQVHNDDQQRGGRVIESVPFYSDVQLSAICADYSCQHKIVYYVKLLKVTYKALVLLLSTYCTFSNQFQTEKSQNAQQRSPRAITAHILPHLTRHLVHL